MKTLKGLININKTMGRDGHVRIEIIDEKSGCVAVLLKMTPVDFSEGLFGLAHRPCVVEFNDSGVIGKTQESKTEIIFVPDGIPFKPEERKKGAKKVAAPHEKNGWKAHLDDLTNHHRWQKDATKAGKKGHMVEVSFTRHV